MALDYAWVKDFHARRLLGDLDGTGRVESAFYWTIVEVYRLGAEDGLRGAGLADDEIRRILAIIDTKPGRWRILKAAKAAAGRILKAAKEAWWDR